MQARLVSVRDESPMVKTFYFRPDQSLDHTAGQFLELTVAHEHPDERGSWRQFTLSNSPTEDLPAITVSFADARSSFKQALRGLQPGEAVSISQPLGDFVLPLHSATPLVWIAGGIGITPFRSIAKWLADQHEAREIVLFHSIRNREYPLFEEIFRAANIQRQLVQTADQGRLDIGTILPAVRQRPDALVYISGPEPMVESLAAGLAKNGIDRQRIVTDAFLGYR